MVCLERRMCDIHRDRPVRVGQAQRVRTGVFRASGYYGPAERAVEQRRDLVSDVAGNGGAVLALRVASSQGRSTVEMAGELDSYSAPRLRRCLRQRTDAGDRTIVLDFRGIEFIDSAGVGVLIGAVKSLHQRRGELIVTSPRPQAAKLFEMTGLNTVLTVQTDP